MQFANDRGDTRKRYDLLQKTGKESAAICRCDVDYKNGMKKIFVTPSMVYRKTKHKVDAKIFDIIDYVNE